MTAPDEERVRVHLCTGYVVQLLPAKVVGTRTGTALIKGRLVEMAQKLYQEPPYDLRTLRMREPQLPLRETASRMGLRPSELSRLECGAAALSEEHWQHLLAALGRRP